MQGKFVAFADRMREFPAPVPTVFDTGGDLLTVVYPAWDALTLLDAPNVESLKSDKSFILQTGKSMEVDDIVNNGRWFAFSPDRVVVWSIQDILAAIETELWTETNPEAQQILNHYKNEAIKLLEKKSETK